MRLVEVRSVLRACIEDLSVTATGVGKGLVRLSGFKKAIEAAQHIKSSGVFADECDAVLDETLILAHGDAIVLEQPIHARLQNAISILVQKSKLLLEVLGDVIPEHYPQVVSVRLPDSLGLKGVATLLEKLEQTLDQLIVNPHIEGKVQLLGFDRGSLWVDLAFGSIMATTFVINVVRIYHEDRERRAKAKVKEGLEEDFKSDIALRDRVRKHYADLLDLEMKKAKSELLASFRVPSDDHEYLGRFNAAYKQLADLLDGGLEVHPALLKDTPPAEVLMPNWKRIDQAGRRMLGPAEGVNDDDPEVVPDEPEDA